MSTPVDKNKLQVTLMTFSDLVKGNTIFLTYYAYEELEKVVTEQITDLFENQGKNWTGVRAFDQIRAKYVTPHIHKNSY